MIYRRAAASFLLCVVAEGFLSASPPSSCLRALQTTKTTTTLRQNNNILQTSIDDREEDRIAAGPWSNAFVSQSSTRQFRQRLPFYCDNDGGDDCEARQSLFWSQPWRIYPSQDDGDATRAVSSKQSSRRIQQPNTKLTNDVARPEPPSLPHTLLESLTTPLQLASEKVQHSASILQYLVLEWWWIFPMALAALPLYRWTFCQQAATLTPEWWKMTCMEYIRASPHALLVISLFLLSNVSYFCVGAWFYTMGRDREQSERSHSTQSQRRLSSLTTTITAEPNYRDLAGWITACGLISTIFHSFQSFGMTLLAEASCYVDHGVALTSGLYFWKVCGSPFSTTRVWVTGIVGLVALATPAKPGYAFLHSSWHFLSALTALFWGHQREDCG